MRSFTCSEIFSRKMDSSVVVNPLPVTVYRSTSRRVPPTTDIVSLLVTG